MMHWKVGVIGSASVLLAMFSIGLLYEGFISDHYSGLFTYLFIDKPAAERAYNRLSRQASIAERKAAAERLIRADPTNAHSWLTVSYADWLANRRLSPAGVAALDHSYAVNALNPDVGTWRVGFALENWADLTPQLRHDVVNEARFELKDPYYLSGPMRARLKTIASPEGHLAATLLLTEP